MAGVRVTQEAVEYLQQNTNSKVRVTQEAVEFLYQPNPANQKVRITQYAIEILVRVPSEQPQNFII